MVIKNTKSCLVLLGILLILGLGSQVFASIAPVDSIANTSNYSGGWVAVDNADFSSNLQAASVSGAEKLAFQTDGDLVVGMSYSGGYIFVYDGIDTTTAKGSYYTGGTPTSLEVKADGTIAYALGTTVTTLSADGSTLLSTVDIGETVSDIAFRPDGNLVVGTSGRVFVLNGSDLTDTEYVSEGTISAITAVAVQSDNSIIVGSTAFHGGALYKMNSTLSTMYDAELLTLTPVMDIAIQSDDDIVAATTYNGGTVAVIDSDLTTWKSSNVNLAGTPLALGIQSNDDVVIGYTYDDGWIAVLDADDMNTFKAYASYDGISDIAVMEEAEEELLAGDANRDGVVSAGDYACVQANFGNTGEAGILGDANGDGVVSAGDYASVQANFGATSTSSVAVPEPATILLLGIGGVLFSRRRA